MNSSRARKGVTYKMDNRYQEGSNITAVEAPEKLLLIKHYMKRIYYCIKVGDPEEKLIAYFERELIPPVV